MIAALVRRLTPAPRPLSANRYRIDTPNGVVTIHCADPDLARRWALEAAHGDQYRCVAVWL